MEVIWACGLVPGLRSRRKLSFQVLQEDAIYRFRRGRTHTGTDRTLHHNWLPTVELAQSLLSRVIVTPNVGLLSAFSEAFMEGEEVRPYLGGGSTSRAPPYLGSLQLIS